MLNFYNNAFYMNTDIKKNKEELYIEGKASDLAQKLKFDLADLYLKYANGSIDYEDLQSVQIEYMSIINDLESLNNTIVRVYENEVLQTLYLKDVK